MSHFLVTGTGRCGTHWASQVLHSGHQAVFRHENTLSATWDWGELDGDCSFEAVPLLPKIRPELDRCVLIVRHPANVVASWLALGAFGPDMRARFGLWSSVLDLWFPTVLTDTDPISRAGRFWHDWNQAALPYATHVLRIEDLTWERLGDVVGVPFPKAVTHRTNRGPSERIAVSFGDLPEETQRLARQWGYS